jgi:hypothetical protein
MRIDLRAACLMALSVTGCSSGMVGGERPGLGTSWGPLPLFRRGDQRSVEGRSGARYTIEIENRTPERRRRRLVPPREGTTTASG